LVENEKSIVKIYFNSDAEKRFEILCQNFSVFPGIIESYTEGLVYQIQAERDYNRRKATGDLGVSIQKIGWTSDPTAKKAVDNVMTRNAVITCEIEGKEFEQLEHKEEYKQDAYTLQLMRTDYNLFSKQLCILNQKDRELFTKYISREQCLGDIADELEIQYESAYQRVRRIRRKMKRQTRGTDYGIQRDRS
jgi:DNA-directed RNA polymerase specialized sigma24 family protein